MIPEKLIVDIIKEQSLIIGEHLARSRAEVTGLVKFKSNKLDDVSIVSTDSPLVIDKLLKSYEMVFGRASVEVCIEVIRRYPLAEVSGFLSERLRTVV